VLLVIACVVFDFVVPHLFVALLCVTAFVCCVVAVVCSCCSVFLLVCVRCAVVVTWFLPFRRCCAFALHYTPRSVVVVYAALRLRFDCVSSFIGLLLFTVRLRCLLPFATFRLFVVVERVAFVCVTRLPCRSRALFTVVLRVDCALSVCVVGYRRCLRYRVRWCLFFVVRYRCVRYVVRYYALGVAVYVRCAVRVLFRFSVLFVAVIA